LNTKRLSHCTHARYALALFALCLSSMTHFHAYAQLMPKAESSRSCAVEVGRYAHISDDGLWRNEIDVERRDSRLHVRVLGTWKPSISDDGSGMHTGQIEGTAQANTCSFSIVDADRTCTVAVRVLPRHRMRLAQQGACLGFGAGVNVSGVYKKTKLGK
jgi:hypothetical protein